MVSLTRFRCSAHKLMMEEGRYRGIERYLRICQLCSMNLVEYDTIFFVLQTENFVITTDPGIIADGRLEINLSNK